MIQNKLIQIKNALTAVSSKCYHYHAPNQKTPAYIVWAEESVEALHGDNKFAEGAIGGTVDAFSKTEFDSLFDDVPAAIEGIGGSVQLNSVTYETDSGLIHYEWVWSYA